MPAPYHCRPASRFLFAFHVWGLAQAPARALIPVAPLKNRYEPSAGPCQSWSVVWFTERRWEADYVPHQVLQQVPAWEHLFVNNLLIHNVTRPRISNAKYPIEDCTLAVVRLRGLYAEGCRRAVDLDQSFEAKKFRRAYMIVGEEERGCDRCAELFDRAPLLFRNYYHEDCDKYGWKVMTLPLGVREPKALKNLDATRTSSQRNYIWSFASTNKNGIRTAMLEAFRNASFVGQRKNSSFAFYKVRPAMQASKYSAVLCESKFALVPKGYHEDTWRLHEALQCGAIPVVTDGGEYFSQYMPKRLTERFITIGDPRSMDAAAWASTFQQINTLLKDQGALDSWQKAMVEEYKAYTARWQREVAVRLDNISNISK